MGAAIGGAIVERFRSLDVAQRIEVAVNVAALAVLRNDLIALIRFQAAS